MQTLASLFADHLRAGAPFGTRSALFAAALLANGYVMETNVIDWSGWTIVPDRAGVPWAGRRLFVGRRAPEDAVAGELWLDTVEVMPMLQMARPAPGETRPPRPSWIATRPVARWQFRGFAAAAPIVERQVQLKPPTIPFDPARLDTGYDLAPITNITFGEATLYNWYFGKRFAGAPAWQGAHDVLREQFPRLWVPDLFEFEGYGVQEHERTRIGLENWQQDPYESPEDEDAPSLIVSEMFRSKDTGFRTGGNGNQQFDHSFRLTTFEPIALARGFPR